MADERPAPDPTAPHVQHSIELDADVDAVLDALSNPDLLAQWLGTWTTHDTDPSSATVLSDDGVARRVRDVHHGAHSVSWTWSIESDPEAASQVCIEVVPTEDGRSRLTVHEHPIAGAGQVRASASDTSTALLSTGWVVALLMLQVLVALRAAAPALV